MKKRYMRLNDNIKWSATPSIALMNKQQRLLQMAKFHFPHKAYEQTVMYEPTHDKIKKPTRPTAHRNKRYNIKLQTTKASRYYLYCNSRHVTIYRYPKHSEPTDLSGCQLSRMPTEMCKIYLE